MPSLSVCQILSRRFLFLDVVKVHVHVGLGPSVSCEVCICFTPLRPSRVVLMSAVHVRIRSYMYTKVCTLATVRYLGESGAP